MMIFAILSFRGPVSSGEPAVRFQGCAPLKTNSSPMKIGQNIAPKKEQETIIISQTIQFSGEPTVSFREF